MWKEVVGPSFTESILTSQGIWERGCVAVQGCQRFVGIQSEISFLSFADVLKSQ